MPTLFSAAQLSELVDEDVTDDKHAVVERVVWGWVSDALGLTDRPDPVSDALWAWALELGAIAFENPKGLSVYQLGEERSQYSNERRTQLLELISAAGGDGTPTPTAYTGGPRLRGPRCSEPYPDPVYSSRRRLRESR